MMSIFRGIALCLFGLGLAGSALAAPTETVLHAFSGNDGSTSYGGLLADSKGNLYGTAIQGGASGYGVVYELSPPAVAGGAWTETVLYAFTGGTDGGDPESQSGLIADSEGNLYGTAYAGGVSGVVSGGAKGYGTVFELSPPAIAGDAWTETVLYSFTGADGANPVSGLIADSNGNLYGTTIQGGAYGTVFELSPPTASGGIWTETVLHSFTYADGSAPYSGVIADTKGNLYGTTYSGGVSGYGYGVVFELSPPAAAGGTWTDTILYEFKGGNDGGLPYSGLITDSKGNLYGTTVYYGSSGNGVAFELSPPATPGGTWTETVLHTFTGGNDGANPYATLIADSSGNLYGTTASGGASGCCGVVFELSPPAAAGGSWTETVQHTFAGYPSDGSSPYSGLVADSKGNLYGTTLGGGAMAYGVVNGTVFELTGTGFATEIPFAAFRSELEIRSGRKPNKDAFELLSDFTLGSATTGINPLTDPVTLTIGTYTAALPPGSFQREGRRSYYFAGSINGADLEAVLAQTGEKRFSFAAAARKADLNGTTNPVPVTLTIGNNTGMDSIKHPERGW